MFDATFSRCHSTTNSAATASRKNSRGSATAFMSPLMKFISLSDGLRASGFRLQARSLQSEARSLQWPRNPAVLPDAPEVHGHQHGNSQRQTDAVQHVEPQQRAFADERSPEQREPRIVSRMN